MLEVKVLGSGCPNCKEVESVARQAVDYMGLEAQIVKVTDPEGIARYRVLATPGLVINERLVSAGRIPSPGEVMTWLADALEAT